MPRRNEKRKSPKEMLRRKKRKNRKERERERKACTVWRTNNYESESKGKKNITKRNDNKRERKRQESIREKIIEG